MLLSGSTRVSLYCNHIVVTAPVTPELPFPSFQPSFLDPKQLHGTATRTIRGFIALRPSAKLLEAALIFARTNNFTVKDGWGHTGWKPCGGYYVGGECGQGFFYSLYYSNSKAAQKALETAGADKNIFEAAQIDRCLELAKKKRDARAPPSAAELQAAKEGTLLRHFAGMCDVDGLLLLQECDSEPQLNIRLVHHLGNDEEDAESLGEVFVRLGHSCAHPQGDEDEETAPAEPRLQLAPCDSKDHNFIFRRLKARKGLHTKLYDCFIPPDKSTPISGKAPNGTKKCKGVENKPCYSATYESYRTSALTPYPPLSVHLKIDTEGSEWTVLEQLMESPEKSKIRTLQVVDLPTS
eukprot:g12325.t1